MLRIYLLFVFSYLFTFSLAVCCENEIECYMQIAERLGLKKQEICKGHDTVESCKLAVIFKIIKYNKKLDLDNDGASPDRVLDEKLKIFLSNTNKKLTSYKYGGCHNKKCDTEDGDVPEIKSADCSAFSIMLLNYVQGSNISLKNNNCASLYKTGVKIKTKEIKPFDMIFFDFKSKDGIPDHCGVVISKSEFVHISSNYNGININNFETEKKWKSFIGFRRIAMEKQALTK